MIGGNTKAALQILDCSVKNEIGEYTPMWVDLISITGWLDYAGGESKYTAFNAKVEETTHIFICDYVNFDRPCVLRDDTGCVIVDNNGITIQTETGNEEKINSENTRFVINGSKYDVLLIDDPMGLHKQIEFYLKYTGGDTYGG